MPSDKAELIGKKKKKHVRFAQLDDDYDNAEQDEEDTLFDKHKDRKRGLKSALKGGGKRLIHQAEVEIKPSTGGVGGKCTRWVITLTLCASFMGLGMCISVVGPTLGDLAANVNKNISNISYIFVGRATGYIGGSLLAGILFDLINPHLLLGFSILVTAFGMFATPFCKKAVILAVLLSSVGVSMGILDTGGNVLILNTWGDQAGPHMQALHFSFAAGALISPIIAKLLFGHDSLLLNRTKTLSNHSFVSLPFFHNKNIALTSMWAYMLIGAFLLFVSFAFLILYSCSSASSSQSSSASPGKPAFFFKRHRTLILLLAIFFFFYVGAEVAYGYFIFTYGTKYIGMDDSHAAELNSLFWGTFAACRGAAIFFSACFYPGTLILFCLLGSLVSTLLMVLFHRHPVVLWSCTALYGASMSATFPSGISWVEQYTTVTSKSAATFVVGAALGEMVLPAVLGFLLGHIPNKPLLMYMALGTAVVTSILFPVMYKLTSIARGTVSRKQRIRMSSELGDSEDQQALLDCVADDNVDTAETEDGGSEAEQWNDADFEVIEMEDASPASSPMKIISSPPDQSTPSVPLISAGLSTAISSSPRRKLLLDREKKD